MEKNKTGKKVTKSRSNGARTEGARGPNQPKT